MDVGDQHQAPADLPSGENTGTHGEGAGWAPEPVWTFIIIIINLFSPVMRWRSSVQSRSQQEIKTIYPSTLQILCSVSLV
jgi:hypothetical protein